MTSQFLCPAAFRKELSWASGLESPHTATPLCPHRSLRGLWLQASHQYQITVVTHWAGRPLPDTHGDHCLGSWVTVVFTSLEVTLHEPPWCRGGN